MAAAGRHAQGAQRRDQPSPSRVSERKVVDRRRKDVRHLLGDQVLGRRHADVDRLGEAADRRARLFAERRVRLVADDELVGGTRKRVDVAREPGIGLDRQRVLLQRLLALEDGWTQPAAVALRRQVAVELVDQQPPVREDEHAHRPGGLDEAGRGDRLAGGGGVAEAVSAHGADVVIDAELLALLARGAGFNFDVLLELFLVLLDPGLGQVGVGRAVAVLGL